MKIREGWATEMAQCVKTLAAKAVMLISILDSIWWRTNSLMPPKLHISAVTFSHFSHPYTDACMSKHKYSPSLMQIPKIHK